LRPAQLLGQRRQSSVSRTHDLVAPPLRLVVRVVKLKKLRMKKRALVPVIRP
jgi:hypothetical protein